VPVVAINRFATDSAEEIEPCAGPARRWAPPARWPTSSPRAGRAGASSPRRWPHRRRPRPGPTSRSTSSRQPLKEKIEAIATRIYGARSVGYAKAASRDLAQIEKLGYGGLPVCMAKTQYSLSDDPQAIGPSGGLRDHGALDRARRRGAGFVVPLLGEIIRMPGLPLVPQAEKMDLVNGRVTGMLG